MAVCLDDLFKILFVLLLRSIMKEALPQFTVVYYYIYGCLNSRGNDVLERVEKFERRMISGM